MRKTRLPHMSGSTLKCVSPVQEYATRRGFKELQSLTFSITGFECFFCPTGVTYVFLVGCAVKPCHISSFHVGVNRHLRACRCTRTKQHDLSFVDAGIELDAAVYAHARPL